jgi:hypothetical protein
MKNAPSSANIGAKEMADELQILHDAINTLALDEKFTGNKLDFVITATQCSENGPRRPLRQRQRTFRVTLYGDDARNWVENPNWDDIWDAYGWHFFIGDEDEPLPNDDLLKNVRVSISVS